MKEQKQNGSGIYIILITAFFLGCFLLLVLFGTNIYRRVAGRQADNNQERAVLGYLHTVTGMNETAVYPLEDADYGTVLVVEDAGTGYGSRIYVNGGYLVEDYGKVGGALLPDYATPIGETEVFEVEEKDEGLLKLTTDSGSIFVHVR